MAGKQISVLIVDDSTVSRQLLTYIIQSDPQIRLLGSASNGAEALKFLETQTPDAIIMDINMPVMNGFEATRRIMSQKPIPIIICSGEYKSPDVSVSFQAIEAGALAILEKPKGLNDPSFESVVKEYITTLKTVSSVKLVTRMSSTGAPRPSTAPMRVAKQEGERLKLVEAVGIGASLGGPQALNEVLAKLKSPFPVPIFIVQHITAGFTEGFVTWLNKESAVPVKLAEHMEKAKPNTIYVAPSEKQMEVHNGGVIRLVDSGSGALLNPSVSSLFRSMDAVYKERALGIILTGMGRDGVQELLQMRNHGAMTIAQSADNCLMFGMPREAINIGAASYVLHIDDIAPFLNQI